MEFSSDVEMRKLSSEAQDFFKNILYDEDPIFVSDEATVWDISTLTAAELLQRVSTYYGRAISQEDLRQPLWKLLRQLTRDPTP